MHLHYETADAIVVAVQVMRSACQSFVRRTGSANDAMKYPDIYRDW